MAEIIGGPDDDVLQGDPSGSPEDDTIRGGSGDDTLLGLDADDRLFGGPGDDELGGGDGDDRLDGGLGNDLLVGGKGYDLASFAGSKAGVVVDLVAGTATGQGSDTLQGIEGLQGSAGADSLLGDGAQNDLSPDLPDAWAADTLDGGDNYDAISYWGSEGGGVHVNLSAGWAIDPGGNKDLLSNIEDIVGTSFDDTLIGSAIDNWFYPDTPGSGGGGNDRVEGRGDGGDTVLYVYGSSAVTLSLEGGWALDAAGAKDTLLSIENAFGSRFDDHLAGDQGGNKLYGERGNDTLEGLGGSDYLSGGSGHDSLDGGEGDDFLAGGRGNDTLQGGAGRDLVTYETAGQGVLVDLAAGLARGQGRDVLAGIERVRGSAFGDRLIGDDEENVFSPDALLADGTVGWAADTIMGGGNYDYLSYADSKVGVSVDLAAGFAIDGGGFKDVIAGVEDVYGSQGADTLVGDAGTNWFWGDRASGTRIELGGGADLMDGGAGRDRALYDDAVKGVIVNLAKGIARDGAGFIDTLVSIEDVEGSAFADRLAGDDAANRLFGNGGDDSLFGGGGADSLSGGGGHDLVQGGAGDDLLRGGAGNDTLSGGGGRDRLEGGAGDDLLVALENGTLVGGAGNDTLKGGEWFGDVADFRGATQGVVVNLNKGTAFGEGKDLLVDIDDVVGSGFADRLRGDRWDNVFTPDAPREDGSIGWAADTIVGGGGYDVVSYRDSDDAVLVDLEADWGIDGGGFKDILIDVIDVYGSQGGDTLLGCECENWFTADPSRSGRETTAGASDYIDGRGGRDRVIYQALDGAVVVDLEAGYARARDSKDILLSIEEIIGTRYDDVIRGNEENNLLIGGEGHDTLVGRGGDDLLIGESGNDSLAGGSGRDVLDGGSGNDTLSGGSGADDLWGSRGRDLLLGGAGSDTLAGGVGADTLMGGAGLDAASYVDSSGPVLVDLSRGIADDAFGGGRDRLESIEMVIASSGDDTLIGSDRNEIFVGQWGDDLIDGGAGIDSASYEENSGPVRVNLTVGRAFGAGQDTLIGIEDVVGSRFADTLIGSAADESFTGDGHRYGYIGPGGADSIDGRGGFDLVSYLMAADSVDVDLAAGYALDGDGFKDRLANIEGVLGSAHDDRLSGSGVDEALLGGEGDDLLHGGGGKDTLVGGAGADGFALGPDDDVVLIADYSTAEGDFIVLPGAPGAPILDIGEHEGQAVTVTFDGKAYLFDTDGDGGTDYAFDLQGNPLLLGGDLF